MKEGLIKGMKPLADLLAGGESLPNVVDLYNIPGISPEDSSSPGLDMAAMYMKAYELGDLINSSAQVADYLYWRHLRETDPQVHVLVQQFLRKKERFEESERFGHFHPNYHEAMGEAEEARLMLESNPVIAQFKQAELALDELLRLVAERIARAISDSVKVSGLDAEAGGCSSGGCSTGGSCSGSCG